MVLINAGMKLSENLGHDHKQIPCTFCSYQAICKINLKSNSRKPLYFGCEPCEASELALIPAGVGLAQSVTPNQVVIYLTYYQILSRTCREKHSRNGCKYCHFAVGNKGHCHFRKLCLPEVKDSFSIETIRRKRNVL